MPIEVHYMAQGLYARISNLADTSFVLDGIHCRSVEGVIWGLKEPAARSQRNTFEKWGPKAKVRSSLECLGHPFQHTKVFWQTAPIDAGSNKHHEIIRRATFEKFRQDPYARLALLSTGDEALSYGQSDPDVRTSLPLEFFLDFVLACRAEIIGQFTTWMARVITDFQEDADGGDAEAYLRVNCTRLGELIAQMVSEQVLKPVPAYVPAKTGQLRRDLRRAIVGMLTLSLEPGPIRECVRGGLKQGVTLQEQLAGDLVWTICAELRGYKV